MEREAACLRNQKIPVQIRWDKKRAGEQDNTNAPTWCPTSALCNFKDCFAENSKPHKEKKNEKKCCMVTLAHKS